MSMNTGRLMTHLREVGEIGKQEYGGVTRLAFSEEYFAAASRLARLMQKETGCQVYRDYTGSLHAVRPGKCPELPEILMGSHLDTVPDGGLYDGAAGVMVGLELMQAMEEDGIQLDHDLHLIAFNAEEAGPLGGTFASRALLSAISQEVLQGPEAREALAGVAETMVEIPLQTVDFQKAKCFLELHIEQGGRLDAEGIPVGAVSGIFGIRRYRLSFAGESNHAGTTPMDQRKDPLVCASRMVSYVYQQAKTYGGELVATVGKLDVFPNLESVIPGSVELILEMRSLSDELMDQLLAKVKAFGREISVSGDQKEWPTVDFALELLVEKPPLILDSQMVDTVEEVCRMMDVNCLRMPSGAGHDAKSFAAAGIPTGMIFVPSVGGKSHCPQELTLPEQLLRGAEVLYQTIQLLDREEPAKNTR